MPMGQAGYRTSAEVGHSKIAFINGLMRYHASRARKEGFEEAYTQAGLTPIPELCVETEFDRQGGQQGMRELWERESDLLQSSLPVTCKRLAQLSF